MHSFVNKLIVGPNSAGYSVDSRAAFHDNFVTDNEGTVAIDGTESNQGAVKNTKIVLSIENLLA
eukprot:5235440-Ditylum_brightwellii.AAC.1